MSDKNVLLLEMFDEVFAKSARGFWDHATVSNVSPSQYIDIVDALTNAKLRYPGGTISPEQQMACEAIKHRQLRNQRKRAVKQAKKRARKSSRR